MSPAYKCQMSESILCILGYQSDPHLNDVLEGFRQNHVSVFELLEYLQQMDSVFFLKPFNRFPRPKRSNFQYPSVGHSHELKHVFSYSPSILHATKSMKFYGIAVCTLPLIITQSCSNTLDIKNEKTLDDRQQSKSQLFTIAGKHDLSDDNGCGGADYEDIHSCASDISFEEGTGFLNIRFVAV